MSDPTAVSRFISGLDALVDLAREARVDFSVEAEFEAGLVGDDLEKMKAIALKLAADPAVATLKLGGRFKEDA